MNLSDPLRYQRSHAGAIAVALSASSLYRVGGYSVNPPYFGVGGLCNPLSLVTRRLSAGPRRALPFRGPHRAGGGDCGTRSLVGSLARRPQAAELWGGVTYYAANRPRAPQRGPQNGSYGAGGPRHHSGPTTARGVLWPRRRGRGKAGRVRPCISALPRPLPVWYMAGGCP